MTLSQRIIEGLFHLHGLTSAYFDLEDERLSNLNCYTPQAFQEDYKTRKG